MIAHPNSMIRFSVPVTDEWEDPTSSSVLRWNVSEYRMTIIPERLLLLMFGKDERDKSIGLAYISRLYQSSLFNPTADYGQCH